MEDIIADQCQVKPKENQDGGSVTEVAVLKVNEANEIRDLYRGVAKFRKTERNRTGKKEEVENEWGALGEIQERNSAGRIDQLNALRFEMQSEKHNMSRGESEGIWEIKCRVRERKFQKKKLATNMGRCAESRNRIYWEECDIRGIPFSVIPDVKSLIDGRFVYRMGSKPISAGRAKKNRGMY